MFKIKNLILVLLFTVLFIGCGGSSSTSSSSGSGSAQKGPFKQGSVVTAYKLNNGERSSTEKRSTTTNDDKGNFSLTVSWSGATEYEISGEYLDENTGSYLSDGTLLAIVNVQANTSLNININIFTHIAATQIKQMLKNNTSISDAKEQAKQNLKEMFSLELDDDTQLEDLDLTDGLGENKSDNTQLLKVSAALLSSNNPEDALAKLTEFMSPEGGINIDVLNVYNDIMEKSDEVDLSGINNILRNTIGASNAPRDNTQEGKLPFNHGLSFDSKVDVDTNKGLISNYIVINNLNETAKVTIQNGEYSLNGGGFTNLETTIENSDSIRVKHYSKSSYGSENITTLNIGLSRITFKSITKANPTSTVTTPNSFTFPIKTNVPLGGTVSSDEIVVSGLSEGVMTKVGITSGAFYQINGGTWENNTYEDTLSFSSVRNGDIVKVSNKASNSNGGKSESTLTIGTVTGKFIVFSREKDIRADLFFPETIYEADLNTIYETPYYTMSGYEGGLDLEVTNGEVQLEGETVWLNKITQIPTGYKVKFRQTSSSAYGTTNKTVITLGRSVIDFKTITKTDPTIVSSIPNDIKFKTVFDADLESFVESEEQIITGMNGTASYAYISEGDFVSINGAEWTTEPVEIALGTTIRVRIKTNLAYNGQNNASLYHGPDKKLFARFAVYNKKQDTKIDDIDFSNKIDVITDTYYESDIVTIAGINYAVGTNIINGEFKINNGDWKTSSQKFFLHNNDTLQLRHKSSINENESVHTIVSFNTSQYEFKTTTSNVPQFLNTPSTVVNQNSNYEYTPSIRDSHTLTYSLISNPSWMSVNSSTGKISGIPSQNDIGQTDTISLLVKSASGLEKSIDFKIMVNDVNDAPILSNTWTDVRTDENRNYSRSASAIDIEGGTLTWSISNNPSWLSINSQTGELTGVPKQANVGTKENIKVTVSEEDGLHSSFTFKITVIDKNSNALLLSISDKTVNENEELIVQVNASDSDGDTLTFDIQNKPSWLDFDTATQILRGTPSESDIGVFQNITISVTDGHGATSFQNFKITVLDVNEAPTILSSDFTKEFILDDTSVTTNKYTFVFDIADSDNNLTSSNVTYSGVITETRVGFAKTINFSNTTVDCVRTRCVANISFAFQDIDGFHPSLKTRHTFTVSDGDKTASNYIDIWYAPTKPILSGEISHTIEVKDKTSYEAFSFTPTNSANKARTWSIKNKPNGFEFDTLTGEIKYSPFGKGLLLNDTTFKGIEIIATNDRGSSEKFVFNILVKGKPAARVFAFNDKVGVEIQQVFDSSITVDWLENGIEEVVTSSDYVGQTVHFGFNVNGQTGISGSTSVQNGDKVTVWHKSSNDYNITLNTTITIGNDSDTFTTTTKLSENTKIPLIVGRPGMDANANELYSYTPQISTDYTKFAPATKPFTIENKPSWANFDTSNGTLSGVPTQVASHKLVRITAYGDNGLDDITFTITVSKEAPYISGSNHSLENENLDFTFNDNADWRSNISEVQLYSCYSQSSPSILDESDYTFTEGSLQLHSSTSINAALHIPIMGGGRLIVKSTGYPDQESNINMVDDGKYAVKATIIEFADNKPITEDNLDEARINIFLSNQLKFKDNTLDKNNFSLYNAPSGVSISNVGYINETTAQVTLSFNGTDFDEDKNIQISVSSNELNICQDIVSNTLDVIAVIEETWSNLLYALDPEFKGYFGRSVDIKNDTIAVAASHEVYIYRKDVNNDYQEVQKIDYIQVGVTDVDVSLDGDYLVVGEVSYKGLDGTFFTGATYVYKKDDQGIYQLLGNITPNTIEEYAHFGYSVSISGNLIIVGAYNDKNHEGAAYLFKNDGSDTFNLVETITRDNGKSEDWFGFDVSIDGSYFVIGSGARTSFINGEVDTKDELGAGFANYYNYLNDTLTLMEVLTPSDSARLSDQFGHSVAISGDHIAIGAINNNDKGSVYLYKRALDTAMENGKIEGSIDNENFGSSIDIFHNVNNNVVVGTAMRGNAYNFTQDGPTYIEHKSTLSTDDRLGFRVAIDKNEVVYGVYLNDDKAEDAGAVLVTNVGESISANEDDSTPHQFTFTDILDATPDEVVSSSVTITGINQIAVVSIVNGQYSLDNGNTWQTEALTLENNQAVQVRHTTSSEFASTIDTTLTVGGISDILSSTTKNMPGPTITSNFPVLGLNMDQFIFSFSDDESWRNSVSEIYYKAGTNAPYTLLSSNDYILEEGIFRLLISSTTNVSLLSPYTSGGKIKFVATGYEDDIVNISAVGTGSYGIEVALFPDNSIVPLTEEKLNGAKIYLDLRNHLEFEDNNLDINNFSLLNEPAGTTISSIRYEDSITAEITVDFDGTDFDSDINMSVIINDIELNVSSSVTSLLVVIEAIVEQAEIPTNGLVIDPYIVNARFWYDRNDDSQEDTNELSTYSNEEGKFTFAFQLPEGAIVKMVEKGLHNGRPFTGDLSGTFSVQAGANLISPVTSLVVNGFTTIELVNILKDAGAGDLANNELLLDPFDSSLLPLNGDMSTYTTAQIEKFRRVLLANVVLNAVVTSSIDGYSLSKNDLDTLLTKEHGLNGDDGEGEEGGVQGSTLVQEIVSIGNYILSEENLKNTNARVMARIFVSAANFASNEIKQYIVDNNSDDGLIWTLNGLRDDIDKMIIPLTNAYIKALTYGITDPKIEWVKKDDKYRPFWMVGYTDLGNVGNKDISIKYKDAGDDIHILRFFFGNSYSENFTSQGQWQINNRIIEANSQEIELRGTKIIINGEEFDVLDSWLNVVSLTENFYEELPEFQSVNVEDDELYVDVDRIFEITLDRAMPDELKEKITCSLSAGYNDNDPVSLSYTGHKIIVTPTSGFRHNLKYNLNCSISYGDDTSSMSQVSFYSEHLNIPLMKTGQINSYDETGELVEDGTLKDDGFYRKGLPIHRQDEGLSVLDTTTKLQWQDDGNTDTHSYSFTKSNCKYLSLSGHTDWRVPTINELTSLFTYDGTTNISGFANITAKTYNQDSKDFGYWSSTDSTGVSNLYASLPSFTAHSDTSNHKRQLCVRSWAEDKTTVLADLTKVGDIVIDAKNNLEWSDNNETDTSRNWIESINYCEMLSLGGKTDWRLPNINELDRTVGDNKVLEQFPNRLNDIFTSTPASGQFWSSTTNPTSLLKAYVIDAFYGYNKSFPKTTAVKARCVRDGS